jgi:NTP pyrophosphatase (non-canonical NTP hydrolase)
MIQEYLTMVRATDQFPEDDVQPILLGLYGEVGSIMTAVKKLKREARAYSGFRDQVVEELGDAFWYLSALSRRFGIPLEGIVARAFDDSTRPVRLGLNDETGKIIAASPRGDGNMCDRTLVQIGEGAASLLGANGLHCSNQTELIRAFVVSFSRLLTECGVNFSEVLARNTAKATSRFGPLVMDTLPDFDIGFPEYEQLPRDFRIEIRQRDNGRVYLRMNDVFIGDPLTDNISEEDGFRYHDVIHLAHAAVLHWSPTIRALLKRKRKSRRDVDEAQDGGRGIVVEEGLAAWVFSKAKELDYFEGHTGVSYDLLKTIQEFVRGYEVEQCPLRLWERCILDGYQVFRLARENGGGIIVGNRQSRTLRYERLL